MTNSLQEQLIKSGLVSEERAEKIRNAKTKPKRKPKKFNSPAAAKPKIKNPAPPTISAEELKQQKKLLRKKIKEFLKSNKVNDEQAQIAFHFVNDNVVKRIYINEQQQKALTTGKILIIPFGERHYLLPQEHVDGVLKLDSTLRVIDCSNDKDNSEATAGDEYADFQVPDDLMW